MGQWVHVIEEKDTENMTGVCMECGPVKLKRTSGRIACGNKVDEQTKKREIPRLSEERRPGGKDIGIV